MRSQLSFKSPIARYVVAFVLIIAVDAQTCYYPNGDKAGDSFACGTGDNVVCCPLQWQCLDNGLCYNPAAKILGRYSCTNGDFGAGCANNYCTYDNTAIGNEAILACNDGRYCCDKNRQAGNCCTDQGFEFVDNLSAGNVFATVLSTNGVAKATSLAGPSSFTDGSPSSAQSSVRSSNGGSTRPTSNPPSSPAPTSDVTAAGTPVVSEFTSIETGSNGPVTIVRTTVLTPASTDTPTNNDDSGGSSNTGMIVGLAVGIPLGLIAIAGILFFLWRRRRQQQAGRSDTGNTSNPFAATLSKPGKTSTETTSPTEITADAKYANVLPTGSQGNPVEIDSRPISNFTELPENSPSQTHSELEGSPAQPPNSFARQSKNNLAPGNASRNSETPSGSSISPAVGTGNFPSSPVSISSMNVEVPQDDLRIKGAHAAHFGGGSLQPVQEGEVTQSQSHPQPQGPVGPTSGQTQGGRFIPYRPPQP
ncbi:hypothetical protein EJ05DRAFT_507170 [Pseudovirgaria hyperparasitica]|uniref:Mid2 domain-containing protein n=1 Tax=Pseudovirgaria hyperparasitica TaxID=470096 RepID=A0A6A6WHN7_9PEZI|nr:uncharacterized protein EJ05DRAFT_507170 [Pseudovirgaria hyperparasitica]KAF2761506.1 hypothetical protein EJ05DRAFT_507170 [Pseudovirgaria hyperparasitica]